MSLFLSVFVCSHQNFARFLTCKVNRAGSDIDVGDLVFEPPRDGPTLWEIGIPDRSAAEFYIPDPDPKYINKLFVNHPDRLVTFFWNFKEYKIKC
jgi:hypothetical protein